jgi:hypothetical protein
MVEVGQSRWRLAGVAVEAGQGCWIAVDAGQGHRVAVEASRGRRRPARHPRVGQGRLGSGVGALVAVARELWAAGTGGTATWAVVVWAVVVVEVSLA